VDDVTLDNLEQRAVQQSFALEAGRHELDALARRLGYVNVRRFLPSLEVGATLEREDEEYEAGPHLSIALPVFNAGPAEVLDLESRVRQQGAMWRADAIELRATAREVATNARAVAQRARYLRDHVLPTQRALVEETVRQYNAMQIDTFALLDAQRREVSARELYVAALRDAWIVRADVEVLRAGGRPRGANMGMGASASASMTSNADSDGGH
jgi:outer membrane protein, heavy metal efflux system